jgi:hypothetical protein
MWCVDLDEVDVSALLCSTEFKIWRITRDRELEGRLVELGRMFWLEHVKGGKAPALTGSESVRTYLDHKYPPPPDPVVVPADEAISLLVAARAGFGEQRASAESGYRASTAEIIAWLGERNATDILGEGWEFRYRVRKDGTRQPWYKRKGEK